MNKFVKKIGNQRYDIWAILLTFRNQIIMCKSKKNVLFYDKRGKTLLSLLLNVLLYPIYFYFFSTNEQINWKKKEMFS